MLKRLKKRFWRFKNRVKLTSMQTVNCNKGSGLIGLLLSVGILVALVYFAMQTYLVADEGQKSTYEQGMTAIDEAEEVTQLIEDRYSQ